MRGSLGKEEEREKRRTETNVSKTNPASLFQSEPARQKGPGNEWD